jgi:hypothetical protein
MLVDYRITLKISFYNHYELPTRIILMNYQQNRLIFQLR